MARLAIHGRDLQPTDLGWARSTPTDIRTYVSRQRG